MVTRDKKNVLIIALLIAVVFMSVGYALLSAQLDIVGRTTINKGDWNVKISDIRDTEVSGTGESISSEVKSIYSAGFSAKLSAPGDSVTYTVTVTNSGTIDVVLDSFLTNPVEYGEGEYIVYSITGLNAGDLLNAGDTITFKVTVKFNENVTEMPTDEAMLVGDFSLTLNYVQAK